MFHSGNLKNHSGNLKNHSDNYSVFSLGTFCVEAATQLFCRYVTLNARYATLTSATLLQGISKYVFLIADNESLHYFYIKPSCSTDALMTRQATKFVCLAFKHLRLCKFPLRQTFKTIFRLRAQRSANDR